MRNVKDNTCAVGPQTSSAKPTEDQSAAGTQGTLPTGSPQTKAAFAFWRSAVVLLVVALAAALLLSNRGVNATGIPGVDMQLPDTIGNYLGFDSDVTNAEKTILPKDTEFAKKRYIGPALSDITCEIVLVGKYRLSIHRPELCMTAQGWNIVEQQSYSIPVQDRSPQEVRVLTLSRAEGGHSFTSYYVYWFVGQNKTTASHLQRYFFSAWDRMVNGVNHRWAYVIVSGLIPTEQIPTPALKAKLLQQLLDFSKELIPRVQKPELERANLVTRS
jgi:hypothetical protein